MPQRPEFDEQLPPDLTGRQLGDFLLLRKLGRGGMADVYLSQQQSLNRQVALKVLQPQFASDPTYIRRFQNEAKAAAALVHPNIVQIFEVGQSDDIHFIAQEYVQGQNLQQLLQRNGAIDPFLAVNMMRQVATALQKAGEAGIVHRDIKPENFMISSDGEVKVADFGLARLSDQPTSLTQTGITMGTPMYMSPEQIEGRELDQRSDIYSFGVTAYQMLTGLPPFQAETAIAMAVQHVNQDPVPLSQRRADLPSKLCDIVHRMMSKKREDRPADGSALLRELLAVEVDQSESNWSAAFSQLTLSEAQALYSTESELEVTQQLDQMIGKHKSKHQSLWFWVAGVAMASVAAFAFGWAMPKIFSSQPKYVLANVEPELKVARKEDVKQQYEHAFLLNTADGWQSVSFYFPPDDSNTNSYYGKLATSRLASMYLDQKDLDNAEEQFDQLYQLKRAADANFRQIGLAGKVIISAKKREPEFVRENIQEAVENISVLDQNLANDLRKIHQKLLDRN